MKVLTFTLTLSLSKGERRPKAAKGEAGSAHSFNSLLTLKFRTRFRREVEVTSRQQALGGTVWAGNRR